MHVLSETKLSAVLEYLTQRLLRRVHEQYGNSGGGVSVPLDKDHAYREEIMILLCVGPYRWQDAYNRNYIAELIDDNVIIKYELGVSASKTEVELDTNTKSTPSKDDNSSIPYLTGIITSIVSSYLYERYARRYWERDNVAEENSVVFDVDWDSAYANGIELLLANGSYTWSDKVYKNTYTADLYKGKVTIKQI